MKSLGRVGATLATISIALSLAGNQVSRTYLQVPFAQKDQAKRLGARWDPAARRWYVAEGLDLAPFAHWLTHETVTAVERSPSESSPADDPAFGPVGLNAAFPAGKASQIASDLSALSATALDRVDPNLYAAVSIEPRSVTVADQSPQGISLSQLLQRVEQVVALAFDQGQWTRVDLIDVRIRGGHVYLELAERDEHGLVLASVRGMIWNKMAERILPNFTQTTGIELAAGIRLLVRARPVMHRRYGLSLEIDALDAAFSLGQLEARRRQIRDRIRQQGLADLQRALPSPFDFRRVLVLAPENAAGLGDFQATTDRWQAAGVCHFDYLHARFQGEGAAAELCRALERVFSEAQAYRWDCLVIIRGGGSVNDLAWLEDEALARAVCLWPVPVLTGIGHERDRCLIDEFAHRAFDTPSKVAAGIIERVVQRARSAQAAFDQMSGLARAAIGQARLGLERQRVELTHQSHHATRRVRERATTWRDQSEHFGRKHLRQAHALADQALQNLQSTGRQLLRLQREQLQAQGQLLRRLTDKKILQARSSVQQLGGQTAQAAPQWLSQRRQQSESLLREVLGQSADRTLRRGFVILRDQATGHPITRKMDTQSQQAVVVQFHDGAVQARLGACVLPTSSEPVELATPAASLAAFAAPAATPSPSSAPSGEDPQHL